MFACLSADVQTQTADNDNKSVPQRSVPEETGLDAGRLRQAHQLQQSIGDQGHPQPLARRVDRDRVLPVHGSDGYLRLRVLRATESTAPPVRA